jgi:uroporphyrinogen-III synthase
MRRLLVLRPEPGGSATAKRARELGLDPALFPLFEIEPMAWHAPKPTHFDGLLLTSANAIRHGGDQLERVRGLPAYAVGEATAEAAEEGGFKIARVGSGGIDELLGSIDPRIRLLHLCGEDRRSPADARQEITSLVVYRAKAIEAPDLSAATDSVALIHSPRAGRRFAELVTERTSISIAAISGAAADASGGGWAAIEIAESPNDDALLALAARLCNKPGAE